MKNKIVIPTILFIAVLIFSVFALSQERGKSQTTANEPSKIVLFYGDGCPHCALVEKFVAENGIEAKVPYTKKEVYHNSQNADELAKKAKTCGMPTDSIGVPFLWDGSKCLVGDQDIIEFFKSKTNPQ